MARGVNKVILIGNLGADPDARVTQGGSNVTRINIATDESYKDKQSGQMVQKTEWHSVVLFNRLAEVAAEYLRKGSKVFIEGKLQTRKWQDQNGQDRYTTEIVANELQMLDGKPDGQQQGYQDQQGYQQPQQGYQQPQYAQQPQGQQRPQQRQQRQPQPQQSTMAQNPRNYAQNQANNYQQNRQPAGMPADDFDDDIPFN